MKDSGIKSKIYERLEYKPQPLNYNSEISWLIQQQISATNGIHYKDLVGKLRSIPSYSLPIKTLGSGLMLDIGCGWGRWLLAGSKLNYTPVGMDLRLEFCQTSKELMSRNGIKGYVVVGDLGNLPFKNNAFSLIWSFSVLQHTHLKRLTNCLLESNNLLSKDGKLIFQLPNKNGIRNKLKYVRNSEARKSDFESWVVRYYTLKEYEVLFGEYMKNIDIKVHSFLGIGVLKEDLKYVTFYNKILSGISLLGTTMVRLIPPMLNLADSLYISAEKKTVSGEIPDLNNVILEGEEQNNLFVLNWCKCPKHGFNLILSKDKKRAQSLEAGIYYPIEDDIPILIESEALPL